MFWFAIIGLIASIWLILGIAIFAAAAAKAGWPTKEACGNLMPVWLFCAFVILTWPYTLYLMLQE